MAMKPARPLLLYALHSGKLYGTERMALATANALRDSFDCVMMAPEGPALAESRRVGFEAVAFCRPVGVCGFALAAAREEKEDRVFLLPA